MLGLYDPACESFRTIMAVGFVLYVVAGLTDILDGYLARRSGEVTTFGRLADPLVDKIMIVGIFVMLMGPNFAYSSVTSTSETDLPRWMTGGMISCVQPWMVVAVLAREFIVSGLRAFSESQGITFPATPAGKIKMFVQSFALGSVIFGLAWCPDWVLLAWVKCIAIWLAVIVTILSGAIYVKKASGLLRSGDET